MQASTSSQAPTSLGDLSVQKSATTDASPGKVWSAIGDFSGIARWHPAVASATVEEREGETMRILTLAGGGVLTESLVDWDDAGRSYTYKILDGPLPVESYVSTISVTAEGEGSRIDWNSTFNARGASHDEAVGVISGIYDSGLAGLLDTVSA